MTWVRLDDQFADHPKVVGLSNGAFRLYITSVCYAAKHETDGHVPSAAVFVKLGRKFINELLDASLWEAENGHFLIHDFLIYNPPAATLRARRAADSARKQGGIQKDAMRPSRPVPVNPIPAPEPDGAVAADSLTKCVQAYDSMMGTMATTPTTQRKIADWLEDNSGSAYDLAEWFSAACDSAAIQDKRSLAYVFAILKREASEGREDRRPKGQPEAASTTAFMTGLIRKEAG